MGANATTYTGAMLFQGVEKYAKALADHAKDFDTDSSFTMGYIIGVVDADQRICAERAVEFHKPCERYPQAVRAVKSSNMLI